MKLYHQFYAHDSGLNSAHAVDLPIVIIPGLFGSTGNWRTFAAQLCQIGDVYVIDQRNHGRSPHAESHTYQDMVNDLIDWCDAMNFTRVHVVGHSMGGKVAMCAAHWHTDRVASIAVLDIAPVAYTHSHAPFLKAMLALDLSALESRSAADHMLSDAIPDKATRLFLLQSLTGSPGAYTWRLNLNTLYEYMPNITDFPTLDSVATLPTVFIRGATSDYVNAELEAKIGQYFDHFTVQTIPGAGHWLHVEQPGKIGRAHV